MRGKVSERERKVVSDSERERERVSDSESE